MSHRCIVSRALLACLLLAMLTSCNCLFGLKHLLLGGEDKEFEVVQYGCNSCGEHYIDTIPVVKHNILLRREHEETFVANTTDRITCVRVIGHKKNGHNPDVTLTSTLGFNFINIKFTSQWGHGIDVSVVLKGKYRVPDHY